MEKYKYSQWNVDSPVKGKIGVLNTLTSAGIIIEKEDFERMRRGRIECLDKPLLEKLIDNWFIVPIWKEKDEDATFWRLYHNIKYRSIYRHFKLVVMPTYKCNFACKYCFEDVHKLEQLREDVVNPKLLIDWIERFWKTYKFKSLGIVFYGGEPLLFKELLKNYIDSLKKWADENRITFSFSIVTDGSLWDEEFVRYMVKNGLREVQITIDGLKEVHDARRPFATGKGSFEVVYNNMLSMIKLPIQVMIRSNIDRHNSSELKPLINLLKQKDILSRKNVLFIPGLVDPSPSKSKWTKKFVPQSLNARMKILKEVWRDLEEVIEDPMSLLQAHKFQFGLCDAKLADSFIIGPDGSLYNCYSFVGYDEGKIGDIRNGLNSNYAEFLFAGDKKVKNCLEEKCPFVPLCTGGCFYQAYIKHGTPLERACPKDFYWNIWLPIKMNIYKRVLEAEEAISTEIP